ncbi:MAG: hypothetical protein WKG07_06750 [Hymenobacter sp.]
MPTAGGRGRRATQHVRHKFQPAANQLVIANLPLVSPFVWEADTRGAARHPARGPAGTSNVARLPAALPAAV